MDLNEDMEKARNALPKYFKILRGNEMPNFHHLRRISVDYEEHMSLDELWKIHEDGMQLLGEEKFDEIEKKNLLTLKALIAKKLLRKCNLCEFKCHLNRYEVMGYCRVKNTKVASYFMHYGEEPELVPSFTIFFSGCNFRCVFCQNWDISQSSMGVRISPSKMGRIIEKAFDRGAKNVNFVGGEPTPNLPYIIEVLTHVDSPIPVVWNSNMYMSEEAMNLLDGFVDIYLGDFKWGKDESARKYSKALNYWSVVTRNFRMASKHYRAEFLIRHLVIPGHIEETERIVAWIAENLGKDVRLNIMFQYRPEYKAYGYEEINRPLNYREMQKAKEIVREHGLRNAIVV